MHRRSTKDKTKIKDIDRQVPTRRAGDPLALDYIDSSSLARLKRLKTKVKDDAAAVCVVSVIFSLKVRKKWRFYRVEVYRSIDGLPELVALVSCTH